MARTAPAPNMIAIPGMNPGNIVAGGGGGAGGAGGKGGRGGKNGKGKGPGEGGDDPDGGDKAAADCGAGGAAGACTKHSAGASAGDPIDVSTGAVFTHPHDDLELDGIIRIFFRRSYSSTAAATDVGLGPGWSHTFDWRFVVGRRSFEVHHDGRRVDFEFVHHPLVAVGDGGWMLRRAGVDFVLDTNDGFFHEFQPLETEPSRYRLSKIRHRNGNFLTLHHDAQGRLVQIVEVGGRPIDLKWEGGHIVQLSMTEPTTGYTILFGRYSYDERGDLVRYVDAVGAATEYAYDERHRMVHHTNPNRLRFYFRYGADGRCFESWGEYLDHQDGALDPDAPRVLRDGTPIRGIHHVRIDYLDGQMTQVVDSRRLRTYYLSDDGRIEKASAGQGVTDRQFDHRGNMISHTGPGGHTWRFEWDLRGRLTATIDPSGFRKEFERNFSGDLIGNVFSDGTSIERWVDPRGNPLQIVDQEGLVTIYEWDHRNLMVAQIQADGTRETYESDHHGNLTRVVYADGAEETQAWDYFGRRRRHTSATGVVTEYSYDDKGQLLEQRASSGERILYGYDGVGNLTSYTDGFGTITLEYGGLNWLCSRTFPNGERERFYYDHEGWLTRELNERGEDRRIERDTVGAVVKESFFDGSVKTYAHDAESQPVKLGDALGRVRTRELDAYGNPLHVVYEDDTEESFTYDAYGRLIRAEGPGGSVELVRNVRGAVIREKQVSAGVFGVLHRELDPLARTRKLRLTDGEELVFQRDVVGRRVGVGLPHGARVSETRDAEGVLLKSSLPEGAQLSTTRDDAGRVVRRWVEVPALDRAARQGAPVWVGASRPGVVLEKQFTYGAGPSPTSRVDSVRGLANFRFDARERLLAAEDAHGQGEHFVHDETSNLYEAGPGAVQRRYGPGDRLLLRGNTAYEYDALGQLIEKREARPDGGVDVWRYEWDLKQQLAAVARPDGKRVTFSYDPFSRRTFKELSEPDATGELEVTQSTHYLWDGDRLVQERQLRWARAGGVRETVVTYLHDEGLERPLAQQRTVREAGQESVGPWLYFVHGLGEAPEELIDGAGNVHAHLERSVYGQVHYSAGAGETTNVGFVGQLFDEETGLYYNRYRYYDPEAGRFVSHDPVGTRSGSNVYHYTPNPLGYCDPLGLDKHGLKVTVTQGKKKTSKTFDSGRGSPDGAKYSDPGKSQLGTHTEPQAINWMEDELAKGTDLKGAKVAMEGEFPPCVHCSKRMREFADRSGATVRYTYPQGKTVEYKPGAKKSPNAVGKNQDDPGLKTLVDNYNDHHDRKVNPDENPKGRQKKEGGPNATAPDDMPDGVTAKSPLWQSYQSEKIKAGGSGNGNEEDDDL